MTTQHLSGKVALIQGGSRHRRRHRQRLAAEGAAVPSPTSAPRQGRRIAKQHHRQRRQSVGDQADSADEGAIRNAVSATVDGRLDILVNNAGVLAIAPLEDFKLEDFDQTLAINVRSVFIASQEAAKHMGEGSRIVNIGSTNADRMPFGGGGTR
jgi:3-oxoacyl-[acyl-carrier protein] reductase